jgi:ribonuclease I
MKNPSFWLVVCLLAASSARAATDFSPGQFDSYTFTMSWEPAFCEGKPSAQECQSQSPDRFDATHLALHGLWPDKNNDPRHDYGYCGVSSSDQSLDRAPTWCQLPEPPITGATRSALTAVMPGVASCLDHHEWSKHGTCSNMAADDYFSTAAALVQKVAGTNFGQFLAANAGKTVDLDNALAAFESDFGSGSRNLVALNCTNVRGAQALLEVRVHLTNPLRPASALASMLISTGDKGNCPSSFLLDPIPGN